MSEHPTVALVVRCPICKLIELAKVIHRDVWPAEMERLPVEDVRQSGWCGGRCAE